MNLSLCNSIYAFSMFPRGCVPLGFRLFASKQKSMIARLGSPWASTTTGSMGVTIWL